MKKYLFSIGLFVCLLNFQKCSKSVFEDIPVSAILPLDRIVIYDPEVAAIVSTFCTECHSGSSPSASLNLSTFQNVRQAMETGEMWERLNNKLEPMPPTGQLSPLTLQILEKWMNDGYPEN